MIHETNPGLSVALNVGSRVSSGDILAYLNDDVVVSTNWLNEWKYWFSCLTDAAAIGGSAINVVNGSIANSVSSHRYLWHLVNALLFRGHLLEFGYMFDWGGFSIGDVAERVPKQVTTLAGQNWAVRKEACFEVGGFNEHLKTHNSEGYFSICLVQQGKKTYSIPTASVVHYRNPVGSTREPYNIARDTFILSRLLTPASMKSRIKKKILPYLSIVYFTSYGEGVRVSSLGMALRGLREGMRYCRANRI